MTELTMVVVDQNATVSSDSASSKTPPPPPPLPLGDRKVTPPPLEDRKETPPPLEDRKVTPPPVKMTNGENPKYKEDSSEDDDHKLIINEEKKEIKQVQLIPERLKRPSKRPVDEVSITEFVSKKSRTQEPSMSLPELENAIAFLKKDLQALEILMVQKEEEWNSLLRLTKHKEEMYARLVRKRQIIDINNTQQQPFNDQESKNNNKLSQGQEDQESKIDDVFEAKQDSVVFLPEGSYAAIGESPFMLLKHFLGSSFPQSIATTSEPPKKIVNGPPPPYPHNISVIDIHTPKNHPDMSLRESYSAPKHILPKPPSGSVGTPIPPSTGFGPQGPTISIQQLIAAHRKDNPLVPPIRGAKRGAWRHKYDFEKRPSSSRESDRPTGVSSSVCEQEVKPNVTLKNNNNSSSLPMSDPSVSYKDVLLQFAQLTQNEKKPDSPQISIIPVGDCPPSRKSEPIPDSTSVSRENISQSNTLDNSSALAKLLMESGATVQMNHSKTPPIDLVSGNNAPPQHLTLSALLSGGTTTTIKDKLSSSSQSEGGFKKSSDDSTPPSTNPKCQGCHKNTAKFVCAGCGNQWYCSRNCQVAAWEDHSEHCTM